MKILLDIQDNKAIHILEILDNLPFVKTTKISEQKALLLMEIKEAVDNLNLVKQGKLKPRPAKELIDEL